jgi:hypothetical protein
MESRRDPPHDCKTGPLTLNEVRLNEIDTFEVALLRCGDERRYNREQYFPVEPLSDA